MWNRHHQLNCFPVSSRGTTPIAFLLLGFFSLPLTPGKVIPGPRNHREA
jgi:hypothetical protein